MITYTRFWQRILGLAVLLTYFAQLTFGSTQISLTSDEPPHIVHGYIILTTGDTWALPEHRHPPLLNALNALPLLLQPEQPDPYALAYWGSDFVQFVRVLWPRLGPIERLAFVTRYPTMLLAILLMAVVYRWAGTWAGAHASLLAITAMAFDPTLIAHSQLNTTDLGLTLFAFAACYCMTHYRPDNAWGTFLSTGTCLGLAIAAKGSGVMLSPILVALLARQVYTSRPIQRSGTRHFIFGTFTLTLTSLLILWASYGFRLETLPNTSLRLPLVAHARIVWMILQEKSRSAFLWGEVRQGGWWWYFPLAFAIKTPVPLIIALGFVITKALTHPYRCLKSIALWGFPVFYLAIAIRSGMNIGYRHLLPIFPFIYVSIGQIAPPETHVLHNSARSRLQLFVGRFTFYALLIWYILGTLSVYPFPIAYFNIFIGGPENGYRYLVDSNVDWGQSFIALRNWMDNTHTDKVALSYYTWIDPTAYGVRYSSLPPAPQSPPLFNQRFDPSPDIYAISATPLQGVMVAERDMYDWFRHRTPIAQPGYGLLVYEVVPHPTTPTWLAQCTTPTIPLDNATIHEGFGRDDLRTLTFECTNGWLYPKDKAPGWYVLHQEARANTFVQQRLALADAFLSYEQRQPGQLPPFAIYIQQAGPSMPPGIRNDLGALTLSGYDYPDLQNIRTMNKLTVETWWRVNAIPDRPLSLMLHLVGPGGQPVIVGDGLSVPREVWQVGDILVQRHELPLPANATSGDYTPYTGVYWLDTLERWHTRSGDDIIALPAITIEN